MLRMRFALLGVVSFLIFSLFSCDLVGGGGGGTGGGTGNVTFNAGFVYVRKDDRNVYIADQSDFQTSDVLTTGAGVSQPSLSKDAQRIVFVVKDSVGGTTSIQTVAVTGGQATTVLSSDATRKNFHHAVFSPDAQTIAFAYDDGSAASIGLVNADGSNFRKLIGGGALAYSLPSFTADGTEVLAAAGNSGLSLTQIERVNVSTAIPVNVTNTLGNEATAISSRLLLSPDGTKAVFDATVSSGVTRIFVIDLSTKAVTKVNDYVGEPNTNDTSPCWMNAAQVAYSSDSGGNDNVYGIGADGSGRELLLPKAIEPFFGPLN